MPLRRRDFLALPAALAAPPPQPAPLVATLTAELAAAAARWDRVRRGIRTRAAQLARNDEVRRRVRELLGLHAAAGAVQTKTTRVVERDGYRIENLAFLTRTGVWVPGNLYLPAGRGPFPGVVSPCGHYEVSRMHPDYQQAYVDMARAGLAVLAFDPPGQGERKELDARLRSVDEHSLAGQRLLLLGENLTGVMVEEGMRAVDVLASRPEVDARRIGCAGHSGGGTLAMYLACADERIAAVAIHEGGTGHRWPVVPRADGTPPVSDAEQCLFPAAVFGLDFCDMHAALAPRPLLATIENYNPAFNAAAEHIRAAYGLAGAPERFATEEAQARHAWNARLRAASTAWLSRWLGGGAAGAVEIPAKETAETLTVGVGGPGLSAYIARRAAEVKPAAPADLARVLRLPKAGATPALDWRSCARGARPPLLTVGPGQLFDIPSLDTPRPERPFAHLFGVETACAHMAWWLDEEVVGMRVAAVLAAAAEVRRACGAGTLHIAGVGPGAPWALFAAALDRRIAAVALRGGLFSYRDVAAAPAHTVPASSLVRGILRHTDLPQVMAALAPRRLTLCAPVDVMGAPVARAALAGFNVVEEDAWERSL